MDLNGGTVYKPYNQPCSKLSVLKNVQYGDPTHSCDTISSQQLLEHREELFFGAVATGIWDFDRFRTKKNGCPYIFHSLESGVKHENNSVWQLVNIHSIFAAQIRLLLIIVIMIVIIIIKQLQRSKGIRKTVWIVHASIVIYVSFYF